MYSTSPIGIRFTGNLESFLSALRVPIPLARWYSTFVLPPSDNRSITFAALHKKSLGTVSEYTLVKYDEKRSDSRVNWDSAGNRLNMYITVHSSTGFVCTIESIVDTEEVVATLIIGNCNSWLLNQASASFGVLYLQGNIILAYRCYYFFRCRPQSVYYLLASHPVTLQRQALPVKI